MKNKHIILQPGRGEVAEKNNWTTPTKNKPSTWYMKLFARVPFYF